MASLSSRPEPRLSLGKAPCLLLLCITVSSLLPTATALWIPSIFTKAPVLTPHIDTRVHITHPSRDIIYDRRAPPPAHHSHAKRQDGASSSMGIATDPSTASSQLPIPFDGSLGNNFTSPTCLPFIQGFLANDQFKACLPFSLLLQTSNQFFTAVRTSPAALKTTIDATCNVNATDCSFLMRSLDSQLRASDKCGPDLDRRNPIVQQATAGFNAYDVLHAAACLKDPATAHYCYADAATNTSAPNSAYVYFLPLGMALPDDARPACTPCLRDTMAVLAQGATRAGSALAADYLAAADTVGAVCGKGFARLDVKIASVSGAGGVAVGGGEVWALAGALAAAALVYAL